MFPFHEAFEPPSVVVFPQLVQSGASAFHSPIASRSHFRSLPKETDACSQHFSAYSDMLVSPISRKVGFRHSFSQVSQNLPPPKKETPPPATQNTFVPLVMAIVGPPSLGSHNLVTSFRIGRFNSLSAQMSSPLSDSGLREPFVQAKRLSVPVVQCNCKSSRCSKSYCECFRLGGPCGKSCRCVNCGNKEAHAPREQKCVRPKRKMKKAGRKKSSKSEGGCKCKKTRCLKKYCECFADGRGCGVECECVDCSNAEPPRD